MIKRAMLSLVCLCIIAPCFILVACDTGLRITGIRIVEYPDRIVYIKGVDTELDLTGGVYGVELKDGSIRERDMTDLIGKGNITHDINFDKEGVYTVKIAIDVELYVSFPVQVISQDYIDNLVK